MLVVGYGKVGRAIAARLLPFETVVTAVASRARPGDELVGEVHGIDELRDSAAGQDVVVVIHPLTEATTGLVGRDFLAAMPDGALLVNVARGQVADTDALVAEASSGRLRVALDVTDPEPLPRTTRCGRPRTSSSRRTSAARAPPSVRGRWPWCSVSSPRMRTVARSTTCRLREEACTGRGVSR